MTKPTISASEITPLLATSAEAPLAQANEETLLINAKTLDLKSSNNDATVAGAEQDEEEKPFPLAQILLCCYCMLTSPIAFFSIFPFINKMIQETGNMPEADVGFYSGLIVCLLYFLLSICFLSVLLPIACGLPTLFCYNSRFLNTSLLRYTYLSHFSRYLPSCEIEWTQSTSERGSY